MDNEKPNIVITVLLLAIFCALISLVVSALLRPLIAPNLPFIDFFLINIALFGSAMILSVFFRGHKR